MTYAQPTIPPVARSMSDAAFPLLHFHLRGHEIVPLPRAILHSEAPTHWTAWTLGVRFHRSEFPKAWWSGPGRPCPVAMPILQDRFPIVSYRDPQPPTPSYLSSPRTKKCTGKNPHGFVAQRENLIRWSQHLAWQCNQSDCPRSLVHVCILVSDFNLL